MGKKDTAKKIAIGTVVAAAAGYVAGILTAPKSGRETRRDIGKAASKLKTEAEKKLKKLHSELSDLIADAEKKVKSTRFKASKGLTEALDNAKKAKEKARMLLTALHDGDADDPNLKSGIKEIAKAKADLLKFLKK